jgi:hypothetical protein
MLCDDITEILKQDLNVRTKGQAADTALAIGLAQRFVLSPFTVESIDMLAEPLVIEKSRQFLFTPAALTWMEWRGGDAGSKTSNRHGVLLAGMDEESIVAGAVIYVCDHIIDGERRQIAIPGEYDLRPGGILSQINPSRIDEINFSLDCAQLGVWIGAALALINTPRMYEARIEDNRKLNARRYAKGTPPLMSWREVNIKIDRYGLGRTNRKAAHGELPRHHVRAHMRIRRGKVELVKPHWRGNPDKGIIRHRHVVTRAEDEAGEWKGGPLPFPEIIKNNDCK